MTSYASSRPSASSTPIRRIPSEPRHSDADGIINGLVGRWLDAIGGCEPWERDDGEAVPPGPDEADRLERLIVVAMKAGRRGKVVCYDGWLLLWTSGGRLKTQAMIRV